MAFGVLGSAGSATPAPSANAPASRSTVAGLDGSPSQAARFVMASRLSRIRLATIRWEFPSAHRRRSSGSRDGQGEPNRWPTRAGFLIVRRTAGSGSPMRIALPQMALLVMPIRMAIWP